MDSELESQIEVYNHQPSSHADSVSELKSWSASESLSSSSGAAGNPEKVQQHLAPSSRTHITLLPCCTDSGETNKLILSIPFSHVNKSTHVLSFTNSWDKCYICRHMCFNHLCWHTTCLLSRIISQHHCYDPKESTQLEFTWRVFLWLGSQVAGATRGISLQCRDTGQYFPTTIQSLWLKMKWKFSEEPDQEWGTALGRPELLCIVCEHNCQQDDGGLHQHCTPVRGLQGGIRCVQKRPRVLCYCPKNWGEICSDKFPPFA